MKQIGADYWEHFGASKSSEAVLSSAVQLAQRLAPWAVAQLLHRL